MDINSPQIKILNSSLEELMSTYDLLEEELTNHLVNRLLGEMAARGGKPKGSVLIWDDQVFSIVFDITKRDRAFHVTFLPRFSTRAQLYDDMAELNHFGRIRLIRITWPNSLRRRLRSVVTVLQKDALDYYRALELAFKSRYSEIERMILKNLYDILVLGTLRAGKDHVIGKAWFSVTNVEEMTFYYHFSRERLDELVKHFKVNQMPEFSPFELVASLISDEVPDSLFNAGLGHSSGFVSMPFVQLLTIEDNPTFWSAEASLFQDSDLSAIEICTHNGYSLQLNCPTRYTDDFTSVVPDVSLALQQQFSSNLKEYTGFRQAISKLVRPVRRSGIYAGARDLLVEVGSSTMAKLLKPD